MTLVFLLVASAVSQPGTPRPCLYPRQFTAQTQRLNPGRNVLERGTIVYDGVNERTFQQDEYRTLNGGDEIESIYLYKEDRHYTIDRRTRTCHYAAIPTTQKFAPYGVPANASFYAQATIGVTPSTVLVNEFGLHEMFGSFAVSYHGQVTAEECFPIKTTTFYYKPGQHAMANQSITVDYYNAVLGIEDPNVFVPPEGCTPKPGPSPPRPPGPPPPAPPHRDCYRGLESDCAKVQHDKAECAACAKKAGPSFHCTDDDEARFCTVRPLEPCFTGLERVCDPVRHDGAACATCAKREGAIVKCTAAQEAAFCRGPTPGPSSCYAGLEKTCAAARHDKAACAMCAKREGAVVHCTAEQETEFCRVPAPPAPSACYQGLVKACEADRHSPALCTACTRKAGSAVHCTAAQEKAFCPAP